MAEQFVVNRCVRVSPWLDHQVELAAVVDGVGRSEFWRRAVASHIEDLQHAESYGVTVTRRANSVIDEFGGHPLDVDGWWDDDDPLAVIADRIPLDLSLDERRTVAKSRLLDG